MPLILLLSAVLLDDEEKDRLVVLPLLLLLIEPDSLDPSSFWLFSLLPSRGWSVERRGIGIAALQLYFEVSLVAAVSYKSPRRFLSPSRLDLNSEVYAGSANSKTTRRTEPFLSEKVSTTLPR